MAKQKGDEVLLKVPGKLKKKKRPSASKISVKGKGTKKTNQNGKKNEQNIDNETEKDEVGVTRIQHLLEAANTIEGNNKSVGKKRKLSAKQTAIVPPNNANKDTEESKKKKNISPEYLLNTLQEDLNEDGRKELDNIMGQYDPQLLRALLAKLANLERFRNPKSQKAKEGENSASLSSQENPSSSSSTMDQNENFPKQFPYPFIDPFMFPYNNPYMMMQPMFYPPQAYGMQWPNSNLPVNNEMQQNIQTTNVSSFSQSVSTVTATQTPQTSTVSPVNCISSIDESNVLFHISNPHYNKPALDENNKQHSSKSYTMSVITKQESTKKTSNTEANEKNMSKNSETILKEQKKPNETVEESGEVDVVGVDEDSNMSTEFLVPKTAGVPKTEEEKTKIDSVEIKTDSLSKYLRPEGSSPANSFLSFVDNINDSSKDLPTVEGDSVSALFQRQKSLQLMKETRNENLNTNTNTNKNLERTKTSDSIDNNSNPSKVKVAEINNATEVLQTNPSHPPNKTDRTNKTLSSEKPRTSNEKDFQARKYSALNIVPLHKSTSVIVVSDDEENHRVSPDVQMGKTYLNLSASSISKQKLEEKTRDLIPVDFTKLSQHLMSLPQNKKEDLLQKLSVLIQTRKGNLPKNEINFAVSCLLDKRMIINSDVIKNQSRKRPVIQSTHTPPRLPAKVPRHESRNIQNTPSPSSSIRSDSPSYRTATPPHYSKSQQTRGPNSEALRRLYLQDEDGDTMLHIAIAKEDLPLSIDIIKRMQGFRLDSMNKLGQTPLHMAMYVNKPDIMRVLLHHGADVSIIDGHGNSLIHIACEENSVELLRCLFEFSTNNREKYLEMSKCKNNQGLSALHIAMQKGNNDLMECLVRYGVNLDVQEEKSGATVLVLALQQRKWFLVNLFIHCGADVNIPTYFGYYPLNYAVQACQTDLVKILLAKNAEVGNKCQEYEDGSDESLQIRKLIDKEMRKRRRKKHLESVRTESPDGFSRM